MSDFMVRPISGYNPIGNLRLCLTLNLRFTKKIQISKQWKLSLYIVVDFERTRQDKGAGNNASQYLEFLPKAIYKI